MNFFETLVTLIIKYAVEGLAVGGAVYVVGRNKIKPMEVVSIGLAAAATFALLDVFAPRVGDSARRGAGFGLGANVVGWPSGGLEGFENNEKKAMERFQNQEEEKKAEGFYGGHDNKKPKDKFYGGAVADSKKADEASSDASTVSTDSTSTTSSDAGAGPAVAGAEVLGFEGTKTYSTF